MAEIERRLAAYLRKTVMSAFNWQHSNCHAFAADWVLQVRGVDPGADFRSRCTTAAGAMRVIRRAGFEDLAQCTAARMKQAGISEIDPSDASVGDVGIIVAIGLADAPQQTLAIRAASGWASPAPRGLMIAEGRALRAWAI